MTVCLTLRGKGFPSHSRARDCCDAPPTPARLRARAESRGRVSRKIPPAALLKARPVENSA
jgi:hypothetical protein